MAVYRTRAPNAGGQSDVQLLPDASASHMVRPDRDARTSDADVCPCDVAIAERREQQRMQALYEKGRWPMHVHTRMSDQYQYQ